MGPVVDGVVVGGWLQDYTPLWPRLQDQVEGQEEHCHTKHNILLHST